MACDSLVSAVVSTDGEQQCIVGPLSDLSSLSFSESGDFLVVAPTKEDLQRLIPAIAGLLDESLVTIFPLIAASELEEDWSDFPPVIAARIGPPTRDALIAIPGPLLNSNSTDWASMGDVADSLSEWMIRQADVGQRFATDMSCGRVAPTDAERSRLRLVPREPDASRNWLRSVLPQFPLPESPPSNADMTALRAGLLQIHDFLEESHQQSQSVEGAGRHVAGDYWHAIMHRREPDYGNSKYWFRRVGTHPLFEELARRATQILEPCAGADQWLRKLVRPTGWDPFACVDLCEAGASDEESPLGRAAREIQWQEMRLLLRHTYSDAIGVR